jgi:hypothetical protein
MKHLRGTAILGVAIAVVVVGACGGGNTDVPTLPGGDAATSDATGGTDGNGGADGKGPAHDAGAINDGSLIGKGGAEAGADAKADVGVTADAGCPCTGGQVCNQGTCACPIYQSFCNGQCIPTSNDANNCGGCGVQCTGALACSGGKCEATCEPGLVVCNNACVDPGSDSDNCGMCGNKCPAGQGCVAGQNGTASCQTAVVGNPPGGGCAGGGPPITVTEGDAGSTCTGVIAQTVFTWALCSCSDVTVSQTFLTDAYDSTQGPYQAPPHQLGGGVGLNGMLDVSAGADIYGTLWASSTGGITGSSPTTVYQNLHCGGLLDTSTSFGVTDNAYIAGDVNGNVSVGKTLFQPASGTRSANVTYGTLVSTAVPVPPPCCSPSDQVPVTSIVAGAAGNNDDAAAGFSDTLLANGSTVGRLDLPCGNYYFTEINPSVPLTIVAHGHTAIYVQGDLSASNPVDITLDPGMTLDVFIAGTINISQTLTLGNPSYPALMRVYVGTTGPLAFSQTANIAADFYAMYSNPVRWSQVATVYGSVYVGGFAASQVTSIHYDLASLTTGQECPPLFQPDAGPPPMCQSCTDCGNQACVNGTCGSCTSSDQCCAPLSCENGKCVIPAQ